MFGGSSVVSTYKLMSDIVLKELRMVEPKSAEELDEVLKMSRRRFNLTVDLRAMWKVVHEVYEEVEPKDYDRVLAEATERYPKMVEEENLLPEVPDDYLNSVKEEMVKCNFCYEEALGVVNSEYGV